MKNAFCYEINEVIEVPTGKIRIKEQIRDKNKIKGYIFECLNCGWEKGTINESNLNKRQGCACCSNKTPVLGINTIYDTDKWMIPYFRNIEETKNRTYGSAKRGLLQCPTCKTPKDKMVCTLHINKSIECKICSDGFSYAEKFMYNILKQLNVNVNRHKRSFKWLKIYKKEYDIFLPDLNILIETHGLQHYKDCCSNTWNSRTFQEEQDNDKFKRELALSNGIKEENYIVIDCRKSELEYLKNSILNNDKINKQFNLSKINWKECEQEALNSYVIEACKYSNKGIYHMDIAKRMNIDFKTVKRYLKKAREVGLCDYKTVEEIRNTKIKNTIEIWNSGIHNTAEIGKTLSIDPTSVCDYLQLAEKDGLVDYKKHVRNVIKKEIICVELNKTFNSINECYMISKQIFGIQLYRKQITKSCDNGCEYNGYHFIYAKTS